MEVGLGQGYPLLLSEGYFCVCIGHAQKKLCENCKLQLIGGPESDNNDIFASRLVPSMRFADAADVVSVFVVVVVALLSLLQTDGIFFIPLCAQRTKNRI